MSGKVKLCRLSARQELEALRRSPALLPGLLRNGLGAQDAIALAGNVCMLWAALGERRPNTPGGVLELFSLSEIADLCEQIASLTPDPPRKAPSGAAVGSAPPPLETQQVYEEVAP